MIIRNEGYRLTIDDAGTKYEIHADPQVLGQLSKQLNEQGIGVIPIPARTRNAENKDEFDADDYLDLPTMNFEKKEKQTVEPALLVNDDDDVLPLPIVDWSKR